jgi:thiol-disulfide isomerase/thioredoxin
MGIPKLFNFLPALALIGAILMSTSCTERDDTATPVLSERPKTTFPMPPSTVTSITELGWITSSPDGSKDEVQRAKIGDYKGNVLVLDMYATWCLPCRESIPKLNDLQRRYGPKGLTVVGLNVGGPDDRVKVAAFARELGINYTLGFPDRQLTDFLMSDDESIPQTFLFDRKGMLIQRFIGFSDVGEGRLEKLIETQTAAEVP